MLNASGKPGLGWTSPISGATDEDQGHDSTDHFQIPFQKERLALFIPNTCCLNDVIIREYSFVLSFSHRPPFAGDHLSQTIYARK
jgi:hypothetical protein